MEITWLGHSCFKIKSKEVTLITDPYHEGIGYSLGNPSANIVTLSHQHPGHNCATAVGGNPKVLKGHGEYEIANVFITGISTFHDSVQGKNRGKNTAYLLEADGIKLCHLGDLGHMPSPQQVEEMGNIQVLLVPVGSISTINAKTAAEIVHLLSFKTSHRSC